MTRNATAIIAGLTTVGGVGAGVGMVQAKAPATPQAAQGRWLWTETGATNYWNSDTGQFLGNGSANAQYYEFDAKGNYRYLLMMEVRTGSMVTKVRSDYRGRVTFNGDRFTLTATSGKYHSEFNGRVTDRPANKQDLARVSKTYPWRLETGRDGKPRFVVPFSDGSKTEFQHPQ